MSRHQLLPEDATHQIQVRTSILLSFRQHFDNNSFLSLRKYTGKRSTYEDINEKCESVNRKYFSTATIAPRVDTSNIDQNAGKNDTDQTERSCREDSRLSASWGANSRPHQTPRTSQHSTVSRGLRRGPRLVPYNAERREREVKFAVQPRGYSGPQWVVGVAKCWQRFAERFLRVARG